MNALITTKEEAKQIVSWVLVNGMYKPVVEPIPNSARVCEIAEVAFEVAPPLFWVACADDVVADQYWYNTVDTSINKINNAPKPNS